MLFFLDETLGHGLSKLVLQGLLHGPPLPPLGNTGAAERYAAAVLLPKGCLVCRPPIYPGYISHRHGRHRSSELLQPLVTDPGCLLRLHNRERPKSINDYSIHIDVDGITEWQRHIYLP